MHVVAGSLLLVGAVACASEGHDDAQDGAQDGVQDGGKSANGDAASGDGDQGDGMCGELASGEHLLTLEHDGETRDYLLIIPEEASEPAPLVINIHGYTMNAELQRAIIEDDAPEQWAEYVIAYPNALDASWNAGDCCGASALNGRDDVGFIRALIKALAKLPCVDDRRVYATGPSNGGFMVYRLACEASDLLAAVAPVIGQLGIPPEDCQPERPVPTMAFNATADTIVPYAGEEGSLKGMPGIADHFLPTQESIGRLAEIHGCDDSTTTVFTGETTTCESYEGCGDGEVILCTSKGGGHCWPGTETCPYGTPVVDISASEAITEFFSRHTLGT